MTPAEEIAKLHADCVNLQRQIVELRYQIEMHSQANAALIEHAVARAVDAKTAGVVLTKDHVRWIEDGTQTAKDRRDARAKILTHVMQWGVGLAIAFVVVSVWDAIMVKIGNFKAGAKP